MSFFNVEGHTISIHPETLAQNPMFFLEMHGELPTLKKNKQILSSGGIGHYGDALLQFHCLDQRWSICGADILQQRTLEICNAA